MAKAVHVVPHKKGWAAKREGASRASVATSTQRDAIDAGRRTAQREGLELVIHGRDGRIRDKDSHGHDPFLRRGRPPRRGRPDNPC